MLLLKLSTSTAPANDTPFVVSRCAKKFTMLKLVLPPVVVVVVAMCWDSKRMETRVIIAIASDGALIERAWPFAGGETSVFVNTQL